jgi:hypothetical protein
MLALAVLAAAQSLRLLPKGNSIGPLAHIQPPAANHHFTEGFNFVYGAEWRMWKAGSATLKLESVGRDKRVVATADASGFVALLFRVHDRFESHFDPHSFCSQSVNKHSEEGLRKRETQIRFDYSRRKSVLDEANLKTNEKKHAEQDIPGCVTDLLSGIYYLGSLPLQPANTYVFPVNDGGQTVTVRATVEGREQIKTDAGTFSTVRVHPQADSGVLKDRGDFWLWYTDDTQKIPVQMRARSFWGTITLRLQRVDKH